jgi:hypothetical protein
MEVVASRIIDSPLGYGKFQSRQLDPHRGSVQLSSRHGTPTKRPSMISRDEVVFNDVQELGK